MADGSFKDEEPLFWVHGSDFLFAHPAVLLVSPAPSSAGGRWSGCWAIRVAVGPLRFFSNEKTRFFPSPYDA